MKVQLGLRMENEREEASVRYCRHTGKYNSRRAQMGFKAYETIINMELMWQMRGMIAEAAGRELCADYGRQTLFRRRRAEESMESKFGFRYPGEVLERYHERCGDAVQNLRALAIAVADEKVLLNDNMFIGNQKAAFIRKIRRDAGDDIYLQAALYILADGKEEKQKLAIRLKQHKAKDSQEYFFLRSVLGNLNPAEEDEMQEFFLFLDKGRTIEAYGNEGIFSWALEFAESMPDSGCKRKAGVVKSLATMQFHQVKKGSVYWEELCRAGYSVQEILYLNIELPSLVKEDVALTKDSIISERIAAQACEEILNADHVENPILYGEVLRLLHLYNNFSIKLEGYRSLSELLKYKVSIRDVDMFLDFYRRKDKRDICIEWFRVDLSDDRYDRLASLMSIEEYTGLFENCFLSCAERRGNSRAWLEKYESLCGEDYVSRFWTEDGDRGNMIFNNLVDEGVLDMVGYITEYAEDIKKYGKKEADDRWNGMLKHMAEKAKKMSCHAVFRFWEVYDQMFGLEALREYTGHESLVSSVIGFDRYQYNRSYYNSSKSFWLLDFLTAEEQRKMFCWACDEIYLHSPNNYNEFLLEFLKKKGAELLPKEQGRELAEALIKTLRPARYVVDMLHNNFYEKEEIERFAEQERIREAEEEKQRVEEQKRQWIQSLSVRTDDDSGKSPLGVLAENCNVYKSQKEYYEVVYACILGEIRKGNCKIERSMLGDLLQVMGTIAEADVARWEDISGMIGRLEVVDDKHGSHNEED